VTVEVLVRLKDVLMVAARAVLNEVSLFSELAVAFAGTVKPIVSEPVIVLVLGLEAAVVVAPEGALVPEGAALVVGELLLLLLEAVAVVVVVAMLAALVEASIAAVASKTA